MYMLPTGKAQSVLSTGDCRVMRQSSPLSKRNNWLPVILDSAPPCRQQFGEILYSAKADLVPNIGCSAFAFRSCLGFILIFKCPGELHIIICGWRSTIFFLSLIPATVPSLRN